MQAIAALIGLHLVRKAVANCTRPLMRSVLMDHVPKRHRWGDALCMPADSKCGAACSALVGWRMQENEALCPCHLQGQGERSGQRPDLLLERQRSAGRVRSAIFQLFCRSDCAKALSAQPPQQLRGTAATDAVDVCICRILIERMGFQSTFLVTAAIKALSFAPLLLLLGLLDERMPCCSVLCCRRRRGTPAEVCSLPCNDMHAISGSQQDAWCLSANAVPSCFHRLPLQPQPVV